jgi:hypothetical protein
MVSDQSVTMWKTPIIVRIAGFVAALARPTGDYFQLIGRGARPEFR